jgi:predicted amidohydrolase
MSDKVRAACVQMTSGVTIEGNIEQSAGLIRAAHADGAQIVGMPEVANLCQKSRRRALETAQYEENEPALKAWQELADELDIWLLAGSMVVKTAEDKLVNRAYMIAPDGAIAATYDKIHMFDVDLPTGERYRESDLFTPGDKAVLVDSPWGGIGITICYDVRFPHLYRALAKAGANMIWTSAAFTRTSGKAHWHVMQRARAIETGCWILAPAQCGDHEDGRSTYGHAVIVSPWGEVVADAGEEPGYIIADLDLTRVAQARQSIPTLRHDRDFAMPIPAASRAAAE